MEDDEREPIRSLDHELEDPSSPVVATAQVTHQINEEAALEAP